MFSAGTDNVVCMVRFLVWIGFFLHLFMVRKGVENIAWIYIHSFKNTFLTDCHILFTNHTAKETCYIKKYVYLETKGHRHSYEVGDTHPHSSVIFQSPHDHFANGRA